MKIIILIIMTMSPYLIFAQCDGLTCFHYGSFSLCDNNDWVLVFEDNFDGTDLKENIWDKIEGVNRDENFEKEETWKQPENIVVENGKLKILTKREQKNNMYYSVWIPGQGTTWFTHDFEFTTGEVWTKFKFPYGKFEAKVKIPKGKGFFPAFWVFGSDPVYNELDIFEFMRNDWNLLKMTSHYDFDNDGNKHSCVIAYNGSDFTLTDHIFTLIWEKNKIEWYVDGNLRRRDYQYYTTNGEGITCSIIGGRYYIREKSYPKDPMHIIFDNVCEPGNYAPDLSTPFPGIMEIDWVKYYQRKPCENVTITSQNQVIISSDIFNVIVGINVSISNSFLVGSGKQLDIIADQSITLGAGFEVELGATFNAKIDNTICN